MRLWPYFSLIGLHVESTSTKCWTVFPKAGLKLPASVAAGAVQPEFSAAIIKTAGKRANVIFILKTGAGTIKTGRRALTRPGKV